MHMQHVIAAAVVSSAVALSVRTAATVVHLLLMHVQLAALHGGPSATVKLCIGAGQFWLLWVNTQEWGPTHWQSMG